MRICNRISESPVAIVGNINLDIKTSTIHASPALFADGETSVQEIYESIGGGGGNMALAASQLGGQVHFCSCVGMDSLGDRLEKALAHFGIISHLRRKRTSTGRSINLNWDNHHRHFISSLPNNRVMTAEDIDVPALARAGCSHLFRADIWFAEAMLNQGNAIILRQSQEMNMKTSIDINWDPEWSIPGNTKRIKQRKSQVIALLPYVSWVHGNEHELALFTGIDNIKDACRFLTDHGSGGVIIHRGNKGAAAFTENEGWIEVPATPVEKIVCETGTGDVFSAAFMLLSELSLRERLQECCRIAARHLQGCPSLIPRLDYKTSGQPPECERGVPAEDS